MSSNGRPAFDFAAPERTETMIVIITNIVERVVDTAKFAAAVWHDARGLQREAEQKYGLLGF